MRGKSFYAMMINEDENKHKFVCDSELGSFVGTICPQVAKFTETGKKRLTLAADTEGMFRIIQSIPSPKAEPFKLWIAP